SLIWEGIGSLPPLGKKYMLQLLHIDVNMVAKLLEEWVLPDGYTKHRVAIDRLVQLRVFVEAVTSLSLVEKPSNISSSLMN
ncbi:hypothetical protein S83_043608, partial [Arachis hypogaea]